MKKKALLAMAIIMVLGSIKSMAMTEEEALDLNALTKIEAAEADLRDEEMQINHVDGAIMATQIDQIEQVNKDIQLLIDQVGAEGSGLQENGLGQLSYLADTYEQQANATQNPDKVNKIWKQAMELKAQVEKIKAQRGNK